MRILGSDGFTVRPVFWEDPNGRATMSIVCRREEPLCATSSRAGADSSRRTAAPGEKAGERLQEASLESDLVPFKPKADVVLVGTAYAPGGKPVKAMEVSIRVGRLRKTLRIVGDRKWLFPTKLALVPNVTDPEPFTTMPLTYDRAFGGFDHASAAWYPENPTGRGLVGKKTREAVHEKPLANIEDSADLITSWDSKPKLPAGFGCYGRGWMPRRKYAGTYDDKHEKERAPKLPLDFSYAFFNCAHPELQVEGYLQGDEEVELRGVTLEGVLRFRLPGIRPKITVARWAVDPMQWLEDQTVKTPSVAQDQIPVSEEEATPVLDTLVFLPDEGIFYEVFRAVVPLKSLDSMEIARIRVGS